MMYQDNPISLAQYLSDLKLKFTVDNITSNTGRRINCNNNHIEYEISINNIEYQVIPHIDTFVKTEYSAYESKIIIQIKLPKVKYFVTTNELSHCYNNGDKLTFIFQTPPKTFTYEEIIETYMKIEEFEKQKNKLIATVKKHITYEIKKFIPADEWCLEDIKCKFKINCQEMF